MQSVIVVLLGTWICGIGLGVATDTWTGLLLAMAVLLALLNRRVSGAITMASLAVLGLGYLYGNWTLETASRNCNVDEGVTGEITARPDVRENSVRYLVHDERGCRFFVYTERWPVYERETVIAISGGRWRGQEEVVADEPAFGHYLLRHQLAGVWSYPTLAVVSRSSEDAAYRILVERVQRLFREPDASLVGALLLAERGQLPPEITEHFQQTGLTHILSISGTHISLVAGMLYLIVGMLPVSARFKTGLLLMVLWGYVWFVGAPVSAVRAGFFWSVTLLALRLGLLVSLPTAILLTLTIVLSWQPLLVLDIGLQLSFLAVVGIFVTLFMTRPYRRRLHHRWQGLASSLLVSLGATVFTWPLVSYHFGVVSFSVVVTNLVVLPVVPIIMIGSIVALGLSPVSPVLGGLVAWPVHVAVQWMVRVVEVASGIPGSWVVLILPGWVVGSYYLIVIALVVVLLASQGRSWREVWE